MDAVPNAAPSYDQQQYKDLEEDPQTDNSVVINPSAMDDLDIQIKASGGFQKDQFMAGVHLDPTQSHEQSLNMGGADSDGDMQGAESDYLNGGESN